MATTYRIRLNVEWDEGSQFYTVTSPDVPEIFTYGHDLREIVLNVQDAIETLVSYLDSRGEARPAALQQPSEDNNLEMIVPIHGLVPA
ncbi:MAG: type II toxin-antitoxin system HicB family antitoxin [Anaerolineae bacterium]|nr:type II toxin-antitoxin system HicB family antitoxin [Anaerolineae bacterium]